MLLRLYDLCEVGLMLPSLRWKLGLTDTVDLQSLNRRKNVPLRSSDSEKLDLMNRLNTFKLLLYAWKL